MRAERRRIWGGIATWVAVALVAGGCEQRAPSAHPVAAVTSGDERQLEVHEEEAADADGAGAAAGGGGDAEYRVDVDEESPERRTPQTAPPPETSQPSVASEAYPSSDDALSLSVGTTTSSGTTTLSVPNIGYPIAREPSPIDLVGYALAPGVPTRVLLATLELPPGERFVPPASSCQDTLLYITSGTLDASGTGIASVDAPATLYEGDAMRFGPEGDGLVVNSSSEPVRTILALARSEDGGPARIALEERGDRVLCPDHGTSDPLSRPQRVASFATSPPLVVSDGALEVRILLDADAAGAEHAGLAVLTASSSFAVPEHVHDGAAEVLYFEDGRGTMHIGERDVDIAPGVTVYVPEGTPHSFEPSGTRELRALQFYAPSGPEQRFRGMAGQ